MKSLTVRNLIELLNSTDDGQSIKIMSENTGQCLEAELTGLLTSDYLNCEISEIRCSDLIVFIKN